MPDFCPNSLGFHRQLDMLDHVGQELEVVQMAQLVAALVQRGQRDEDVDQVGQAGVREVVGVELHLVVGGVEAGVQDVLGTLAHQVA